MKQMLSSHYTEDKDSVISKLSGDVVSETRGVVFYSVPHYGSTFATNMLQSKYRYVLLPSSAVSELRRSICFS